MERHYFAELPLLSHVIYGYAVRGFRRQRYAALMMFTLLSLYYAAAAFRLLSHIFDAFAFRRAFDAAFSFAIYRCTIRSLIFVRFFMSFSVYYLLVIFTAIIFAIYCC